MKTKRVIKKNPLTQQVKALRLKIKASDLSHRQIYQAVHISEGWFMRMIRGDFHEPNPVWMARINDYLDDIATLKEDYKPE